MLVVKLAGWSADLMVVLMAVLMVDKTVGMSVFQRAGY